MFEGNCWVNGVNVPIEEKSIPHWVRLNDSIILSMISYFRGSGFNAYLMPKPSSYKYSNSRDDVIITKK